MRAPQPAYAKTRSITPVSLRDDIEIQDPLQVVSGYLESWRFEAGDASSSFDESDLRLANRGGARISAAEIAAILERRRTIELAFADIRGIGLSKMTKALHPKLPELVPMLDSVVQTYLAHDDLGADAPFGERALALVRGYKRDLDLNRRALRATRQELVRRGHDLTEVRILDLLIWSARVAG